MLIKRIMEPNPEVGKLYYVLWAMYENEYSSVVFDTNDFKTRSTTIIKSVIIPVDDIILYLENCSETLHCHKILWKNQIGYVYKLVTFFQV